LSLFFAARDFLSGDLLPINFVMGSIDSFIVLKLDSQLAVETVTVEVSVSRLDNAIALNAEDYTEGPLPDQELRQKKVDR
jgi:hypothetical protein